MSHSQHRLYCCECDIYLYYNGNLKNIQVENLLIKKISEQIKLDFPDISDIKFNIELIGEICNAIEEIVKTENLTKVNKLELFYRVYERIFGGIPEQERKMLFQVIEYLHNNDKIKVRPVIKKIVRFLKGLIKKN